MYVYLNDQFKKKLKDNQSKMFEMNGQIHIKNNKIAKLTSRKGQLMQPCKDTCSINYHTHPSDYLTLYPDHPSTADFKYIYNATSVSKEFACHLVCTPKYIYSIYYLCRFPLYNIFDFFFLYSRIDNEFKTLSQKYDRSTEEFRQKYMSKFNELNFHIDRFNWNDDVYIEVPNRCNYNFFIYVVMLIFFIKKYMVYKKWM